MEEVKIYSTPSCPYCHLAKDYLNSLNVPFQDIDVSTNQLAAQEMIKKSGQLGVPVIEIDGKIIVGFDKAKIKELVGARSSTG